MNCAFPPITRRFLGAALLARTSLFCHLFLSALCLAATPHRQATESEPGALNTLAGLHAAGAEMGEGIRQTSGPGGRAALLFSGRTGVSIPVAEYLTARSGGIDLRIQVPSPWPVAADTTLFHLGETGNTHITLFFRQGVLVAPYKPDETRFVSMSDPRSQQWTPGSWHRIQFTWRPAGERDVALSLRVDDETVGSAGNLALGALPTRFHLGQRGTGRQVWPGAIEVVSLSARPLPVPELQGHHWEVAVETRQVLGRAHNFWSVANTTSQYPFTDLSFRETFRLQKPHALSVNCVRLLGGRDDGQQEWFKGVDATGHPICDFRGLIAALRGIQEAGYTPRLVLDNVPTAMSAPGPLHTYGNTRPPQDYAVYHAYIGAATQAMIDAFGPAVVGSWRFRVMTEPDLFPGHWSGTKQEWLRLYDTAVDAVTRLLPEADIGPGNILNPAQAGGKVSVEEGAGAAKWGLEIVDHCATGRNFHTGAIGTRMRFFSCSWYGRVGTPISGFELAIRRIRERLDRYPQFRSVPVEVAEFSVLNDERGRRIKGNESTEWGGSFLAAIADRAWRLDVRQIHQWGVNSMGLPTPYTHVLGMLEQMAGGERLAVSVTPNGKPGTDESGVVAVRQGDAILLLLYHHRPARAPGVLNRFTLHVRGLAGTWSRTDRVTDADHGVFMRRLHQDCEAAGLKADETAPAFDANPAARYGRSAVHDVFPRNRATYARLAALSPAKQPDLVVGADGIATLALEAPAHSVRLIELRPARDRTANGRESRDANTTSVP